MPTEAACVSCRHACFLSRLLAVTGRLFILGGVWWPLAQERLCKGPREGQEGGGGHMCDRVALVPRAQQEGCSIYRW